ncbi:hypothetical protein [Actinospica robiniae]|uniref:hypothetical protein n=1 Tax=Actinospica robiniae TaxID=304901 RepID=UPI001B7FB685|nr:hypothetical protein [Actinospica robiniae]
MPTTYESADELTAALIRAAEAHGRHEQEIGHEDPEWPVWYAQYMVAEQDNRSGDAGPGQTG